MDKTKNPIWQHHQKNVDEGTYVKNDDGSISTVFTTIMGDGEYEYLIPQVWDGEILSAEDAWDRAMSSGIDWPKEPSGEEGVRKLEQLDEWLHEGMSGYADGGDVSNFFDQSAEELEFYIKEMGYDKSDPTQAKFLRDEWTKQNTLSGQMKGAFGAATEVPEGRERAAIAPMTKPEGMTGIEAIRTGQAKLAVPGFLTGVAEEALDTATTGQKMTSGISTTREEAEQAGMALGSATMAEVPRAMGRALREGVDRSVVSVGGSSVTKKKSEINPLFKPKDVPDENLVTFYSPLRSAIEEMQFSEKGKSGQEIMAYLTKRAPNVNKGEVAFSRLDLNPKKKYSKAEVLDSLQFSVEGTKANFIPRKKAEWEDTQVPRNYLDKTEDYFEITLDAEDLPEGIRTHHGETTLGHSRATVHTPRKGDGDRYVVLNEIQSDALQNVGKKFDDGYGPADSVADFIDGLDGELDFGVSDKTKDILDFVAKEANKPTIQDRKALIQKYKEEFGVEPKGRDLAVIHKDAIRQSLKEVDSEIDLEGMGIEDDIDNLLEEIASYNPNSYTKSDIPVSGNTDYVKNLIVANIAKAKEMGIDTLVVPDLEEIARLRVNDFDGGIDAAMKALKPTYVDAVKKAVRVLNNEYGDRIKLGTKDIDYEDLTKPDKIRKTKGLALDISNFDFDPTTQKVRFAEGGEVKSMEEQMSLFERGGLADGGLDREPVTGNEVPPGSMPSEVRDDVPAQLSEGEYVVPADVVRYYGVKFFEDLRTEAKGGMMKMDQEGRIGGTAVDANGVPVEDDTLSPEEEQMLMEALASDRPQGMATGGMVRGYATAGDVTKPTYTPTGGYGAGPMQMGGYGQAGSFEARQYVNTATGQVRTFQFLNGMPISMIPEGFVPATQEAIAAAGQVKDQTTTETAGTGQATGQVEPEGRGFDPEKDTVSGEGRTKDPTAPFGIGTGKVGTGLAAGVVGGALTGGLGGALGFGKAGMQAGAFNEARNGLVDAMLSGDKDAIAKAKEDVTSTYGKLGNLAHIGVFNEGKTAQDAIAYVEKYTNDLMAKYNITPGPKTRQNILAAINKTPTTSTAIAKNAPGSLTKAEAQLGSAASITAKDKAAGAAYAATGDAREDTWQGGGVAENQGWSGGQMDYGGDTQGGGAVGSARGGRATGGLVGKPSKNPPKKKSATKGLGGRR